MAAYSFVILPIRFLWPFSLSPLYEMPPRISLLEPRFGLAIVPPGVVTVALIILRCRWPAGLTFWAFSALMLAPTSAAMRLGVDLAPDRSSYLPGLGFAFLVGGAGLGVIRLARRERVARPIRWTAGLPPLLVLGALDLISWSALGGAGGTARAIEAERLLRRAIALRPDLPDAYFNRGTALVMRGRYGEAKDPLRTYMERVPDAAVGSERLGLLHLLQRRYDTAIPLLPTALLRSPEAAGLRTYLPQALQERAVELQARGQGTEADALLTEARTLGPDTSVGSSTRP